MSADRLAELKNLAQAKGCALLQGPTADKLPGYELWSGNELLLSTTDLGDVEAALGDDPHT